MKVYSNGDHYDITLLKMSKTKIREIFIWRSHTLFLIQL